MTKEVFKCIGNNVYESYYENTNKAKERRVDIDSSNHQYCVTS